MKVVRFGPQGAEKVGVIDTAGGVRDASAIVSDLGTALRDSGTWGKLLSIDPRRLPAVEGSPRLGACVPDGGRIFCIGLNYTDHALEAGMPIPAEPVLFMKACAATGPNDPIVMPRDSRKMDWEVELGIVIGRAARDLNEREAASAIAGYCLFNDVSEREFQLERGGQWIKGKSYDGFAPAGPWLVSADEVPDPQQVDLWLEVNGRRFQEGSTSRMIFGVHAIVAYLSRFVSLRPGDLIATGTPAGVGLGQKREPVFLKAGDVVTLGATGLGEQRQQYVAPEARAAAAE